MTRFEVLRPHVDPPKYYSLDHFGLFLVQLGSEKCLMRCRKFRPPKYLFLDHFGLFLVQPGSEKMPYALP
jgi:hypothetical protein